MNGEHRRYLNNDERSSLKKTVLILILLYSTSGLSLTMNIFLIEPFQSMPSPPQCLTRSRGQPHISVIKHIRILLRDLARHFPPFSPQRLL